MRILFRFFQYLTRFLQRFMPYRTPKIIEGEETAIPLTQYIKEQKLQNIFIVTDAGVLKAGLLEGFKQEFDKAGIGHTVYHEIRANPTIMDIEAGLKQFKQTKSDAILALGGGSVIDAAKIIGARVAKPGKSIQKMEGLMKIRRRLPPLIAIPTTAGSGSEVTLTAVVTDEKTKKKYTINDFSLIPKVAVLDAALTTSLPKDVTINSGLDVLSHAVESFVNKGITSLTKKRAKEAVQLVFENLPGAVEQPDDLDARRAMLNASMLGGLAFRRAYVGYVHAMAHALGGVYNLPHGYLNAILLPHVLRAYGHKADRRLSELAECVNIKGDTAASKAAGFIKAIEDLNARLGIPKTIRVEAVKQISFMAKNAAKEANPLYPVPRILTKKEIESLYKHVLTTGG